MKAEQRFPQTLRVADFMSANQTAIAGKFTEIGVYTVLAQQEVAWGANDPIGGASVAGKVAYIKLVDTTNTQLNGLIRLTMQNANGINKKTIIEETTAKFSASNTSRTSALLLPEQPYRAKQDSKLTIEFKTDSATNVTVDYDGTDMSIELPVTVYYLI